MWILLPCIRWSNRSSHIMEMDMLCGYDFLQFRPVLSIQQLTLCVFVCCVDDSFIHVSYFKKSTKIWYFKNTGLALCLCQSLEGPIWIPPCLVFFFYSKLQDRNVFRTSSLIKYLLEKNCKTHMWRDRYLCDIFCA
jgi:hypothetical protein